MRVGAELLLGDVQQRGHHFGGWEIKDAQDFSLSKIRSVFLKMDARLLCLNQQLTLAGNMNDLKT